MFFILAALVAAIIAGTAGTDAALAGNDDIEAGLAIVIAGVAAIAAALAIAADGGGDTALAAIIAGTIGAYVRLRRRGG